MSPKEAFETVAFLVNKKCDAKKDEHAVGELALVALAAFINEALKNAPPKPTHLTPGTHLAPGTHIAGPVVVAPNDKGTKK